jgi:D-arginine dehydrogenase
VRAVPDFLVVGGGIAGASAACFLSRYGGVTLLEAERSPGVHATGRSAGLFSEYYGTAPVRALTSASRAFYASPPQGFAPVGLLHPRGVLAVETPGTAAHYEEALRSGLSAPEPVEELGRDAALALCPALRPGAFTRALYKPGARDVDVDAAHQGFLRSVRAAGGTVVTSARVTALERRGGRWHAGTTAGDFAAPVVVNAAGAWAEEVAALAGAAPQGLVPRRRTAALARVPDGYDVAGWPMVGDVADTFYARPESGGLMLSPVDAEPVPPGDVRPDDLDVAVAVERFTAVVDLPVRHVPHAWAGLRTSGPDDVPVIGPDPRQDGFCWLAGLGGYGIQTAPAAGALLAALVTGEEPPPPLAAQVRALAPGRARRTSL